MIELEDTTSSQIAQAFVRDRRGAGGPTMGMVLTLVVVVDEDEADQVMEVAREATRGHPSRVLGIILGQARGRGRVDAHVGVGRRWGGEAALIRLRGAVVKHPESVVLPLLLPDSPVAVWWASDGPDDPSGDPLGSLATRRLTDLGQKASPRSTAALRRFRHYQPGDTDLAWTRLTLWRAVLAAVLDQHQVKVTGGRVRSEAGHPSASLLRAWLADRLKVDIALERSEGPAVTEVVLETAEGDLSISRPDGGQATLRTPGRPDRTISLRIRDWPELLSEELRHLDPDEAYAETVAALVAAEEES
ncbi:glucose-6-phosphate dehydrogenase assembly protein OpcA [Nocardioides sp. Y6]|uniref:Glucose-6-phosphate dehydrogenase assembly protein OpcA n=1 Tax=Nocardioides malaquae TaxID=2773426 RepID=A0ABR9RS26_9ACTN|nr:glucose-6-phosphate dehydrogenase assembly protein OpcA [Nocardioides malaquae]MBE7324374.1 glucose-6-phosphate dehydrogenase assembly protein OpcA [Nocardioides malaquae]